MDYNGRAVSDAINPGPSNPMPFELGDWRVEPSTDALYQGRRKVHLQPKIMEMLLFLVEHRDRVVSKEEILAAVWPDTFVAEVALTRCISQLRRALDDDTRNPRFIETIPKKGYRIVAPVGRPAAAPTRGRPGFFGIAAICLLLTSLLLWRLARHGVGEVPGEVSVAVLPFKSLGAEPENGYFSDGFTDEVIAALSGVSEIRVISRTSVMRYRDSAKSLPEIARELGVRNVLEGSARIADGKVRLTAQLFDARTEELLWGEAYERELPQIYEIQWDMAQHIVAALRARLRTPSESESGSGKPPESLEAYNLSLLARYFRNRESKENFLKAIDYYQQALSKDPSFALGHAGLAEAYLGIGEWGTDPNWAAKAEASAKRALEIDSALPEARVALGMVRELHYGDLAGAEAAFKEALSLNSHHANAHRELGLLLLRRLGRMDEALSELQRAYELDPLSPPALSNLGEAHRVRGEFDKAVPFQLKRLELDSGTLLGLRNLAQTSLLLGNLDEVDRWIQKAVSLDARYEPVLQLRLYLRLVEGKVGEAGELSRQLLEINPQSPRNLAAAAVVALRRDRVAEGRRFIETAARLGAADWCWPADIRIPTLAAYFLLRSGEPDAAMAWLSRSLVMDREKEVDSGLASALPSELHDIAMVYALRGDPSTACKWLNRAISAGWRGSVLSRDHPAWGEELRTDENFGAMMNDVDAMVETMRQRLQLTLSEGLRERESHEFPVR